MLLLAFTFTFFFTQGLSFNSPALHQITEPVDHAEGPTWDGRKGLLYFVDIHDGKIYSYDYGSSEVKSFNLGGDVAVVVPSKSDPNLLIVGVNRSIVAVEWNGRNDSSTSSKVLTTVADDKPTSRFNDGKADKEGRLWFGTMGFENASGVVPNQGALYHVTKDNLQKPTPVVVPVTVSNGLAWNKANNKFYYIDTPTQQVKEYDYDNAHGTISNPRVVFDARNYTGRLIPQSHPDGMTIDKDDNLWIALYNGGAVIQVDPKTQELLKIIPVPALHVTSVAWGGPHLDILFVTTSRYSLTAEERLQQPGAGSVYAIRRLQTNGLPAFEADIIDSIQAVID